MVEDVEAVGPAAVVGVVTARAHRDLARAIVQVHAVRNDGERAADHELGDADATSASGCAVGLRAAFDQKLQSLFVVDVEADPVEDLERREVDFLALPLAHARVVRAAHVRLVSGNH